MTIDAKILKELVMSGDYDDLTVREFVELINEALKKEEKHNDKK